MEYPFPPVGVRLEHIFQINPTIARNKTLAVPQPKWRKGWAVLGQAGFATPVSNLTSAGRYQAGLAIGVSLPLERRKPAFAGRHHLNINTP
ncbi:hypothetical protein ACFSQT_38530 [Mesorhizobium calcicola]|uniref:Uncharacterized protein n=1 Tax=Mesorhizobium calcicola TaxID=1300310 RepID=A0ABW4WS11_9HYPH